VSTIVAPILMTSLLLVYACFCFLFVISPTMGSLAIVVVDRRGMSTQRRYRDPHIGKER
jgi:hypothetical protein